MRDEAWLYRLLDEIWDKYFADVPQDNVVRVVFGRRAKTRLGSIRLDPKDQSVTLITVNGLFRDTAIPEYVVRATLVHELCHYAHGFHSPLEQKFTHPHSGGVVRAEFAEKGLTDLYLQQKRWLKQNWKEIVNANFSPAAYRRSSRRVRSPFWF